VEPLDFARPVSPIVAAEIVVEPYVCRNIPGGSHRLGISDPSGQLRFIILRGVPEKGSYADSPAWLGAEFLTDKSPVH
jgi:hypothetical protein